MKKITAIFVTAIMMLTLAMPAFATDFVDSVTGQPAPGVEDVTIVDENDNVVDDKGKSGISTIARTRLPCPCTPAGHTIPRLFPNAISGSFTFAS